MLLEIVRSPNRSGWTRKKKGLKAVETSALERHLLRLWFNGILLLGPSIHPALLPDGDAKPDWSKERLIESDQHHNKRTTSGNAQWYGLMTLLNIQEDLLKWEICFIVTLKSQRLCKVQTSKEEHWSPISYQNPWASWALSSGTVLAPAPPPPLPAPAPASLTRHWPEEIFHDFICW